MRAGSISCSTTSVMYTSIHNFAVNSGKHENISSLFTRSKMLLLLLDDIEEWPADVIDHI